VLGLFFIGGIILLEKSQGVLMVIVVSPLKTIEYILAKVISLTLIATLATVVITLFGYHGSVNWVTLIVSTIFTSSIFTLLGIIINAGCKNVNQYMLKTIPYMLLFVLPCFSLIGYPFSNLFLVFPSVAALKLMMGSFLGITWWENSLLIIYLFAINYLFLRLAIRTFERKIVYLD
jgi:fluoroquinolone transport system permease protein